MARFETLSKTLSASGTLFTIDYPEGKGAADYLGGTKSELWSHTRNLMLQEYGEFSLTFGASSITVTSNRDSFVAGETVYLKIDVGVNGTVVASDKVQTMAAVKINLGAPDTADPNGAVESQACTAVGGLATGINGALASGGVATFDVPRNVVAAWTTSATLTVTGTDEFGNVVVESSGAGTSMAGKKAFKTITGVASSVDITGLTVGSGDVLGLPCFLPDKADVVQELEDGAAPTAGTILAGVTTTPTATTGDVRGTYDPNSACNGTKVFELLAFVRDPNATGQAQYAG